MSTITKAEVEAILARIHQANEKGGVGITREEGERLARIALASLEAEPVAHIFKHPAGRLFWSLTDESNKVQSCVMPVYTAPPAPVSVPEKISSTNAPEVFEIAAEAERLGLRGAYASYAVGWNACRAAMLQGAEPVTTAYKLPASTPCKDAPEHIWLQTAGVWTEDGEFSELTWCSDNQHEDDTLYVRADVATAKSPVIPDGWELVPIEPTEDMIVNGFESEPDESFSDEKEWATYDAMSGCQQAAHRAKLCWAAMVHAAPKYDANKKLN